MFRRLRLPGKLVLAAVPLIVALVAVSTLYVRASFDEAAAERRAAELSVVLSGVRNAVDAVGDEATTGPAAAPTTDGRIAELRASVTRVDAPPLARQLDSAVRRLDQARESAEPSPTLYDQVSSDLLSVASLVPAEVANPDSARALQGVAAIGRARQAADVQQRILLGSPLAEVEASRLELVRSAQADFTQWVDVFHTVASPEARTIFAQSGAPVAIGGVSTQVGRLGDDGVPAISDSDWQRLLDERATALATFEDRLRVTVQSAAGTAADRATAAAWIVVGVAAGALILAAVMTALISRSIVRRVRSVTERAQHVAQEQLPALVEALRDPGEDAALPTIPPIRDRGADEVGDLARSFSAMQSTLEHVAAQQVETLRKGVAEMFVTLARRNRSLIDRQLALIDELEADEEDPAALADFYRLDHMATRMRRNAESLLVLAGSEPPRTWRTPLGIDDVVRAAIGEIEDYRRVDVLTLEQVRLKGSVVADLSHLLSELLENATQFSPPQTRVRVSGHFHEEGYLLTVSDRGVGIPQGRIGELNHLLDRPPVIGLALEPTLGLYVVAMLAKRHGIQVRLVPGAPGVSAKLLVPPSLYDEPVAPESHPLDETRARPEGRHRPRSDGAGSRASEPTPIPTPRWGPPSSTGDRVRPAEPVAPVAPPPPSPPQPPPPVFEPAVHAAAESRITGALPVRSPGGSYSADPGSERPVTQPARPPDAVRSSFGAFQTGLEAGRRDAAKDGEE